MQVRATLEELMQLFENAKSVPLSSSCMVNRDQVLDLLDQLAAGLPTELSQANTILAERETVLEDARTEAERIVERARAEASELVSREHVYREALAAADELRAATDIECSRQRRELDDYVDAKLAAFEAALVKTLDAVAQGREKTAVRLAQAMHAEDSIEASEFFRDWSNPRP